MSGWSTLFDVADLAINIGQSAQLASQRRQIESLHEQAAVQAARQRLIEAMRNFVFASGQQLKVLTEFKEEAPEAVYVASRVMAYKFEAGEVTPQVFAEFRDKEYVQEVTQKLQDTLADARSRLNADELKGGDECVGAVIEMPLLNEAIESIHPAIEGLSKTQREWDQLEAIKKKGNHQGWLWLWGIMIGWSILSCLLVALPPMVNNNSDTFGLGFVLVLGSPIIVGISIAVGAAVGSKGKTPRWKELKAQREAWREKAADQAKVQRIKDVFGSRTTEGYKALRDEKNELIHRVLGEAARFTLSPALLESVNQGSG